MLRALAERCLAASDRLVVLAHAGQAVPTSLRPPYSHDPDRLAMMLKLTLEEPQREAAVTSRGGEALRVLWRKWSVDGEAGRLWAIQRASGELVWAGWNPPEGLLYSWLASGNPDGWPEPKLEPWRLNPALGVADMPGRPVTMPSRGLAQLVKKAG